jgi:hypothetical protein
VVEKEREREEGEGESNKGVDILVNDPFLRMIRLFSP